MKASEVREGQVFVWHSIRHEATKIRHPVSTRQGPARVVWTRSDLLGEAMWILPDDDDVKILKEDEI